MSDLEQLVRDLAARVDALERENRTLRATVVAEPDTTPHTTAATMERLSRRWVLRRGMQVAAASVAAAVLVGDNPDTASANHYDDGQILVDSILTHVIRATADYDTIAITGDVGSDSNAAIRGWNTASGPGIYGLNSASGPAIVGYSDGLAGIGVKGTSNIGVQGESGRAAGYGIFGRNNAGTGIRGDGGGAGLAGVLGKNAAGAGVKGEGGYGVWGVGANGVVGESTHNGYGAVYGKHVSNSIGPGVVGDGAGTSEPGVLGRNAIGAGVKGEGGFGVWGVGNNGVVGDSTATDYGAVWGNHKGTSGYGVVGDGKGTGRSGVLGRNAAGEGVRGEGATGLRGTTTSGVGVAGEGGSGYGGVFRGIRAQVRLTPTGRIGKPTTGAHQVGELYLDRAGTLFICTVAGTPGTWHQVTTTLA